MRLYVDTSALVKLWIDEDGAEAVRIAFEDAIEVASSLRPNKGLPLVGSCAKAV